MGVVVLGLLATHSMSTSISLSLSEYIYTDITSLNSTTFAPLGLLIRKFGSLVLHQSNFPSIDDGTSTYLEIHVFIILFPPEVLPLKFFLPKKIISVSYFNVAKKVFGLF